MNRNDYVALLDRIAAAGEDSRIHYLSGARTGAHDPWDPSADAPGQPVTGLGSACRDVGGDLVFVETLKGTPHLVIAGAGHVGVAVAHLGVLLGFRVIVVDERPEFADPARLPGDAEVLCGDYGTTLAALPPYGNAYYVLVTPGHRMDREAAAACLARPSEYVGMIGSRGKCATVRAALTSQGISPDAVARLRAPIGLELGGREPAEIAVAIAAEIIQVRARSGARSFDPNVATGIRALASAAGRPAVLATIVGHGGSVPRGAGSRMLVDASGPVAGSVGGGPIEAESIAHALALLADPDAPGVGVQDYGLSNAQGAELGMICGGRVRVLFERL